jgi:hypothetical protein
MAFRFPLPLRFGLEQDTAFLQGNMFTPFLCRVHDGSLPRLFIMAGIENLPAGVADAAAARAVISP